MAGRPADTAHDAIIKVLDKVDDWDFDVFALQKHTNGGSLFMMTYTLLYKYGLVQHFNIKEQTMINFLQESPTRPPAHHMLKPRTPASWIPVTGDVSQTCV